jgi:L,D-transpeptidase YcbB
MSHIVGAVRCSRLVSFCSAVTLALVIPALAAEDPATPVAVPAAIVTPDPAPAAAVAPAIAEPAAAPPVVAAPVIAAPIVAVVDPVIEAIRLRLAKPASSWDKGSVAALNAFYGARADGSVWTDRAGFNERATATMAELRKADDWGLSASAFVLPKLEAQPSSEQLVDAEITLGLAVLKYARQASGGQVDPAILSRFNDHRGTFVEPRLVLSQMASSAKPATVLQSFHPQHAQFQLLHEALIKLRKGGEPVPDPVKALPTVAATGPSLKPGVTHPDIAIIRERLAIAGTGETYDKHLVSAVKGFQSERGLPSTGTINAATRAALNGGVEAKKKDPTKDAERIVLNMERWRWLPDDLGRFHILNNIPEYITRVSRDGQVIHTEKIIVGKTNTSTPQFTANMQFVIFHPEWGVPDSIKLKEIWPSLRRSAPSGDDFFGFDSGADTRILQRQNIRVSQNGKEIDARKVDWRNVDPRQFQFIQASGGANVLGVVKFRFPNRHDVYMHDTPQRDLFNQTTRMFSHGCMRVNNPRRLAEVILAEDRGWTADRVGQQIASPQSLEVKLQKPFPVHSTYFTARVEEDGKLKTFSDIYGHDAKLSAALAGKPVKLEDLEPATDVVALAKKAPPKSQSSSSADASLGGLLQGLFGN